jgi:hypothetical protein
MAEPKEGVDSHDDKPLLSPIGDQLDCLPRPPPLFADHG